MKKLVHKIRIYFWIAVELLTLMSLSFLMMPIADSKEGLLQKVLLILTGILFWIPGIGGYTVLIMARKK